jgi:hypothetical protein
VSYLHVQRLASVRDEYAVVSAATTYLARVWHELGDAPEVSEVRFSQLRRAIVNLEATYVVRLFSEFEGILYYHLVVRYPGLRVPRTAEALISRVSLRERIPDPLRDAAQSVREYRNAIVHRPTGPMA